MTKEYTPIYNLGFNEPVAIVEKDTETGEVKRTKGTLAIFSGVDMNIWINGKYRPALSVNLGSNYMNAQMCIGNSAFEVINNDNWVDFHIVGITQEGDRGLISGKCKCLEFNLNTSIDSLNTEVAISFESKVSKMIGFMGVTDEQNQEIGLLVKSLREIEYGI